MLKKTLLIIFLISWLGSYAQSPDWYKYPIYCDAVDQVVEASNKVYYLSGGNMYSFSPDDNESYAYNRINKLSGDDILKLYYNHDKQYLVIVYADSNIDLLYDDGRLVNMPDIKNSTITSSKQINDVAFGNDRIAVATDFGIVIFSDVRHEVIESGIYNAVINCVAIMHDHLVLYGHYATNYGIMAAPLDVRHNTLDKFKKFGNLVIVSITALDNDHIAMTALNSNELFIRKLNFDNYTWGAVDTLGQYRLETPVLRYKNGHYAYTADQILDIKPDGVTPAQLPESLRGSHISAYDDIKLVWAGDALGLGRYDISSTTPAVLYDKMLPDDYTTDKRVGFMRRSPDGSRLYISNLENSLIMPFKYKEGSTNYQTTNIITGHSATDVSLIEASTTHYYGQRYQQQFNNRRMYGDPNWMVEDPDDPDKYYMANYFEGVYIIKRNPATGVYEEIGKFTEDNAPITSDWGQRVLEVNIDPMGNLWIGTEFGSKLIVLPADKRRLDPSAIKKSDWRAHKKVEALDYAGRDMRLLFCRHSNMMFYSLSAYEDGLVAIDTKGTLDNPADDNVMHWGKFVDQDGNQVTYTYITSLLEDNRGCVWVGTYQGVFEITNPSAATNATMTIRRIKVPRNDGTNYADYLLDSELITSMALDPAGRKWIATANSGIYLVSETGDEILRHYDTSNSPLPTNMINCIDCDPNDNTVYVGTNSGLYSFKSDAAPGHADFSEIIAYPNPVRPEYSGYVTITGLKDKSLVKITDSMGNVVYETRSEGGMAQWDACNSAGSRVKSGVYYVYASQSDGSSTSGAVTKILVIN